METIPVGLVGVTGYTGMELARILAAHAHALAVNLDPAQTVLDTFLELDATLGRVRAAAA